MPARHITTWESQRILEKEGKKRVLTIYNQIDYILIPQNRKQILRNARSYKGTLVCSDHRLVVSKMCIDLYHVHAKVNKAEKPKMVNSNLIGRCEQTQRKYQEKLNEYLNNADENQKAGERWNFIKEKIMKAANETAGKCTRLKNGRRSNPAVEELSEKQKKIRVQISNTVNVERVIKLRSERNNILKEIQRINNEEKEKELEEKVSEIEKMKD